MKSFEKSNLTYELFDIGVIKFGDFTLKSGNKSPIYVDLRIIISYPDLLIRISKLMGHLLNKDVKLICGVPYTAIPLSSIITSVKKIPMVMRRKEVKLHGTCKMIEGVFKENTNCVIIEDIISTGSSILETVDELNKVKLICKEAIVLIDRCQNGRKNLETKGIKVQSVLTLVEMLEYLLDAKKIDNNKFNELINYIKSADFETPIAKLDPINYQDRSVFCRNPIGQKLMQIIHCKRTKLCVAADVNKMQELIDLTVQISPYICMLKVHANIISDFNVNQMKEIKQLAQQHQFLILEDGKFGDIGEITCRQLTNEHYDYLSWCDIITVHCMPGQSLLDGVKAAASANNKQIGCLLIAEMSCNKSSGYSANQATQLANDNQDIVLGFISQSPQVSLAKGHSEQFVRSMLHCTPGIKMSSNGSSNGGSHGDSLGQNYRIISEIDSEVLRSIDVFIVGRSITKVDNPLNIVKSIKQNTWLD